MPGKTTLPEASEKPRKRTRRDDTRPSNIEHWLSHLAAETSNEDPYEVAETRSSTEDHYDIAETQHMCSESGRSVSSDRAESLSAYNLRFLEELEKRKILFADHQDVPPPLNEPEILRTIDGEEPFSQADFKDAREYRKVIDSTGNEADVVQSLMPRILPIDFIRLYSDMECTLANHQWQRSTLTRNDIGPSLVAPKPDQVIGFKARRFPQNQAKQILRQMASPVPASPLLVPYFVAEAKGEQGSRKVAKRQNMLSQAISTLNFYKFGVAAGMDPQEFFNRIHLMSTEITTETIQAPGYWRIYTSSERRNVQNISWAYCPYRCSQFALDH